MADGPRSLAFIALLLHLTSLSIGSESLKKSCQLIVEQVDGKDDQTMALCGREFFEASSDSHRLAKIMFWLSTDYLDVTSQPSAALLRLCLRPSSANERPNITLKVSGNFLDTTWEEEEFSVLVSHSKMTLRPNSNKTAQAACRWVEINVQRTVSRVFQQMHTSSMPKALLTLAVRVVRGEPASLLNSRQANELPVLVLKNNAKFDVALDQRGPALDHSSTPGLRNAAGADLGSFSHDVSPRRSARSAGPDDRPCRPTTHGFDGSLLVERRHVEFVVQTMVPNERIETSSPTVMEALGNSSAKNNDTVGHLEPTFTKKTTVYVLPRGIRYLVIHRCRGTCTHLSPNERVPLHYKALNYFARPSAKDLDRLCCKPKTFADSPSVTVQLKHNRSVYRRIALKQLHASSCQCTWM